MEPETFELVINKYIVSVNVTRVLSSTVIMWTQFWSRTIEFEDGEWANGDDPWPEFYRENAL